MKPALVTGRFRVPWLASWPVFFSIAATRFGAGPPGQPGRFSRCRNGHWRSARRGFDCPGGQRLRSGFPRRRPTIDCGQRIHTNSTAPTSKARATCCRPRGRPGWSAWCTRARSVALGSPPAESATRAAPVTFAEMSGDYKRSKFQAEQVAWNSHAAASRGHRQPHRTDRRSRREAHSDGQDRTGFPQRRHAGHSSTRAQRGGRARRRRRPLAWRANTAKSGSATFWVGESDARADSRKTGAADQSQSRPPFACPYAVAYGAGLFSTALANITGTAPRIPLEAVRMAKKKMWVSVEKARRELGFTPGPAEQGARPRGRLVQSRAIANASNVGVRGHGESTVKLNWPQMNTARQAANCRLSALSNAPAPGRDQGA